MERTCKIATALMPKEKGYSAITFPNSKMEADGWRRLLELLSAAGVRVTMGVYVPDSITFTDHQEEELRTIAAKEMLSDFDRRCEDWLWRPPLEAYVEHASLQTPKDILSDLERFMSDTDVRDLRTRLARSESLENLHLEVLNDQDAARIVPALDAALPSLRYLVHLSEYMLLSCTRQCSVPS